jgi:uncharacterized membrane protein YbhN (UPF0104 family)
MLTGVIVAGAALYILPALIAGTEVRRVLEGADWALVVPTIVAYLFTFVGAVEVLRGAARRRLAWIRTLLVTVASSYANRAAPAALGRTMLDRAYFETMGLTADDADDAVTVASAAGGIVHAVLLVFVAVGVLVAPHSAKGSFDTTAGVLIALAVVAAALAFAWWRGNRQRLEARLRTARDGLRRMPKDSGHAVRLFGGSAVVTLGYTAAFVGATLTIVPGTAGLGAALVYLVALPLAALLPVPGGVVVLDTALVVGELANGADIVPAVVAVLLFRLITFWMIIVPGYFAYRRVARDQGAGVMSG